MSNLNPSSTDTATSAVELAGTAAPSVATELRRRRELLGWTQAEAARRSGVSRTVINEIEVGRRVPQTRTYERLRGALGLSLPAAPALLRRPEPRDWTVTQTIVEEQVVKSRHRVKTYGEVFTPRRMVNRMLDLVREELEAGPHFVDKTFLEPAAGGGNFLVAILHRKLNAIEQRYQPEAWSDESLFALASIYGIELLEDNHRDAKEAMLAEFLHFHARHEVPCGPRTGLRHAGTFLIDTNIVRGDTLTGLNWRSEAIHFSWWNRVPNMPGMVRRDPFRLASLRDDSVLDFTVYDTYAVCRIDQVHEQVRTGG